MALSEQNLKTFLKFKEDDAEGKMVGSSKVTLPNTVICFWGDDETTTYKDGLYISEQWHIKLWSSASQTLNNIGIKHPGENTYLKKERISNFITLVQMKSLGIKI